MAFNDVKRLERELEMALARKNDYDDEAYEYSEQVQALQGENARLRAALAQSELPCVYCSLPKEKWGECASGFPGCSRGDDSLGCPMLDRSMELEELYRWRHVEDELPNINCWVEMTDDNPVCRAVVFFVGYRDRDRFLLDAKDHFTYWRYCDDGPNGGEDAP